jgi:hypothetical protein
MQSSASQRFDGASGRRARLLLFAICPLPRNAILLYGVCHSFGHPHIVRQGHVLHVIDKESQCFPNAAPGLVNRSTLSVAPTDGRNRCLPPAGLIPGELHTIRFSRRHTSFLYRPRSHRFPRHGSRSRSWRAGSRASDLRQHAPVPSFGTFRIRRGGVSRLVGLPRIPIPSGYAASSDWSCLNWKC